MLLCLGVAAQPRTGTSKKAAAADYQLRIHYVDKDPAAVTMPGIPAGFPSQQECARYINRLPAGLQASGYINASIDSVRYDSTFATILLYVGSKYTWTLLDTRSIDPAILAAIGWKKADAGAENADPARMGQWQERLLRYMENNGYPFAAVYLDSLQVAAGTIAARLRLDPGPLYRVDSIRLFGTARVSNSFLQHYLDIPDGSPFSREKLERIGSRIGQLSFLVEEAPATIVWVGTGAVVELHLKARQSSQVNVLVGLQPNNEQLASRKLLLTGEANLALENAFGAGESIGLHWQQLQVQSPQLHLLYRHPFLFNRSVGLDLGFDMFRRDSAFLNVDFRLGARYAFDVNRSGALFLQQFRTIVNQVDTVYILQQYRLPDQAGVSTTSIGLDYQVSRTDYRPNPASGAEFRITTTAGIKKIRRSNEVLELKDPGNPSFDFARLYDSLRLKTYQVSIRLTAAKYFPLGRGRRSTVKAALQGGWLQSSALFRNELFRIGGYRLLRGFDEESQYLSQFAIGTAEYRYRAGRDAFFYVFTDGGWGRDNSRNAGASYFYIGTGAGLSFTTRAGIFNLAWAVGKRSDLELNLRQSKIHFGFASSF